MEGSNSSLVDAGAVSSTYENSLDRGFTTTFRKEYVEIIEQPAPKALRFRYECEGRSAGSIPGISSTPENKTYPTIQVAGYDGRAVVVVSCVTKDEPYRPHPHNLVGREGCKKGVCTLEIPPDTMTVSFSNLGIQCVKKKDIESSLRTREEIRVDPFRTGFSHKHHPTSIDLNAVRLCFQVFLEGDKKGKFTVPLPSVVSEPILDKKASADLVIVKLSDCNSHVDGGRKDIILLCEKVAKEDIQIRFFEEKEGKTVWEGYGDFQSNQVHKQTSIWFRAPKYRTLEVTEPVKAFIQLKRPSDGATSEPLPFEFLPLDAGRPSYWSLGRSLMKTRNSHLYDTLFSKHNINLKKWKPEENKLMEEIIPSNKIPVEQEVPQVFQETEVDTTLNHNLNEVPINEELDATVTADVVMVEANNNEIHINNNEDEVIATNINDDYDWTLPPVEDSEEKSFNQLIDEVAELDEIYSTSQFNKNAFVVEDLKVTEVDTVGTNFDDSKTYSSLQMAFKAPLKIAYRPTEDKPENIFSAITEENIMDKQPIKRESPVEKLPPLPPKRQKKIETYIGEDDPEARLKEALLHPKPSIIRSHSFSLGPKIHNDELKYLGSTSTLPNPKKKGFFSKFFGRKNKNKSNQDISSTYNRSKSPQISSNAKITSKSVDNIQGTPRNTPARDTIKNIDNTTDAIIRPPVEHTNEVIRRSIVTDNEEPFSLEGEGLDLTDAEHYALYTVMAPHATQSEFDEMSCYYAAVEGGKILS